MNNNNNNNNKIQKTLNFSAILKIKYSRILNNEKKKKKMKEDHLILRNTRKLLKNKKQFYKKRGMKKLLFLKLKFILIKDFQLLDLSNKKILNILKIIHYKQTQCI